MEGFAIILQIFSAFNIVSAGMERLHIIDWNLQKSQ